MQNAPGKAFSRARPVVRPRQAPRPFVLSPEFRADIAAAPIRPGAWLPSAIAAETRVMTPAGPRAAGLLATGDMVLTLDHGALPLRWIGRRAVTAAQIAEWPEIGPVEIPRNAFGGGTPRQTLRLSPLAGLHLHLPGGPRDGVLLDARSAIGHAGIRPAAAANVTYVQLLLDRHAIIAVDGLPVETFHPAALSPAPQNCSQQAEILGLFPELDHGLELYGPDVRPRAAGRR